MTQDEFRVWMQGRQQHAEDILGTWLPGASSAPERLHAAMRYAVLGGGKRVRAVLAFAVGEFCRAPVSAVAQVAAAVELIHAYSLVHDDLPCMDDDDFRRGQPSCHKQFDEATALLVGDALQSLAFAVLSQPGLLANAQQQLQMLEILSMATGSQGMVGGQAMDLASVATRLELPQLMQLHACKTGALILATAQIACCCAPQGSEERMHVVMEYARTLGVLFQVIDDILDETGDARLLGKTQGKDGSRHKPTCLTMLGLPKAQQLAQQLYQEAVALLVHEGGCAEPLRQLAYFVWKRQH